MSKWIKYEIDSNTLEFRYESDSNNQNFSDETDSNIPKTKLEEIIKVPRLIGNRFEVYDILSKGGFGVILKAKNKVLKNREVLIKTSIYNDIKQELIHKYDVTREDTINQRRNDLRNEYQRLIMFRNGGESRMPSVIDVIEDYSPQLYGPHIDETTGEEFYLEEFKDNEVYLVMQNIDGINLGDYLSKGIDNILKERNYKTILFWEVAVLEYIKEVVNIFTTFHRKKYKGDDYFYFIYQDLKPDNIMLTYDKFITLIDFGGILMVGNIDGQTYSNFENAGIPGCGTFGYMPREMCESEELKRLDNRADIYTIGATMYSLLSAKNPLDDVKGSTQRIPVDKLVDMGYTQETIEVIRKATNIDKYERYKSIESLQKEIIRCLGNANRQINKIQSFKKEIEYAR